MRASWRSHIFVSLLFLLACAPALGQNDCSGHGTFDASSEKCVCTTPTPGVGATGYTGESCEIETIGVDTPTVQTPLTVKGDLPGEQWRCYFLAVPLPENGGWNHLAVSLEHPSNYSGDPDVHGVFFDVNSRVKYPQTRTDRYDFREVSSSAHKFVDVTVARDTLGDDVKDSQSVFLCVQAYGSVATTYTLTAAFSQCPTAFRNDMNHDNKSDTPVVSLHECSVDTPADSQPAGQCDSATGKCQCNEYPDHTFKPPRDGDGDYGAASDFYSTKLGFGACAARVDFVDVGSDGSNSGGRSQVFREQTLSPGQWRFYKFTLNDGDHQVVVTMNKQSDDSENGGYASMYVRHETVPTNHWGHYDLPDDFVTGNEPSVEVTVTEGDDFFQKGVWYVGVFASSGTDATFDVEFNYYDCPRNCSDRGLCVVDPNDGTRTCQCYKDQNGNPYLKEDCREEFSDWTKGNEVASFVVNGTLESSEYDYFALPSMDLRESKRQIEVVLSASYSKSSQMYAWEEKPVLLLKREESREDFPSIANYTFKVTLEEVNLEYKIELCASQFAQGVWNAAVYNPEREEPMSYVVSFRKKGVCPSANDQECSGHGTCRSTDASDPNFATCKCDDGWTASDCNFPSCPDGSFISLPPGADGGPHATCFRGCQGGKRRKEGCDEVVCAPPSRQLSNGVGDKRCVVDECDGDFFKVNEDEDLSCVLRCKGNPLDPSAGKRLSTTCDPETVRSNAGEIGGGSSSGNGTGWWSGFFVVAIILAVVGGVFIVARGGSDDGVGGILGDKWTGFVRSVRSVFSPGDGWDRRRDQYQDVDDFSRADFD